MKAEKRTEWSDRDKATIDFDIVTGIKVVYDPITLHDDEANTDDTFYWTLEFTLDGEYEIRHCYYLEEDEAKHEAYLYAKMCWGKF